MGWMSFVSDGSKTTGVSSYFAKSEQQNRVHFGGGGGAAAT